MIQQKLDLSRSTAVNNINQLVIVIEYEYCAWAQWRSTTPYSDIEFQITKIQTMTMTKVRKNLNPKLQKAREVWVDWDGMIQSDPISAHMGCLLW